MKIVLITISCFIFNKPTNINSNVDIISKLRLFMNIYNWKHRQDLKYKFTNSRASE